MDLNIAVVIIAVASPVISVGMFAGVIMTKINYLEKKMDKHNNLIERMAKVEASSASAHHRIDDLKDEIS